MCFDVLGCNMGVACQSAPPLMLIEVVGSLATRRGNNAGEGGDK